MVVGPGEACSLKVDDYCSARAFQYKVRRLVSMMHIHACPCKFHDHFRYVIMTDPSQMPGMTSSVNMT